MERFEFIDVAEELRCAICLDPFDDPVELVPCGHLFCKHCVASIPQCPSCRATVSSRKEPHRAIRNLADDAVLMCSQCGWKGTRKTRPTHQCAHPQQAFQAYSSAPVATQQPTFGTPVVSNQQQKPYQHPVAVHQKPVLISSSTHAQPWILYGLDQEEYDQIVAIFMTFDEDDSGELDRQELTKLARWLNFAQQPGDIDRMFRDMDTDRSGSLSLEEFCSWLKCNKPDPQSLYGMPQREYNVFLMQFRSFDANQDGLLNLAEFQRLCQNLHMYRSPQEAAQAFTQIDLDHSGTIDLHEFLLFRAHGRSQPAAQQNPNTLGMQSSSSGYYPNAPMQGYYPPQHAQHHMANGYYYPQQQQYQGGQPFPPYPPQQNFVGGPNAQQHWQQQQPPYYAPLTGGNGSSPQQRPPQPPSRPNA